MLTPYERAALVAYCNDHPVAVCPQCTEAVTFDRIGADIILEQRDFCPKCRGDLTLGLRKHLAECTFIRVQSRQVRELAQELRQQARETAKESHQLRDTADVLTREAEAARQAGRRARRGQPPA